MGAGRYEVVIINARTKQQSKREWRAPELLKSVKWLKRMNAQGGEIYLRPLDGPELLLVDMLNAEALKDMHRKGFVPAVTVETAPGGFQAWVELSDHPVPQELLRQAVSGLASVFPTVWQHGLLAGFTNQQAEPNRAGRQSYVLAHQATGTVAPAAQPYLAGIERHLRESAAEKQRQIAVEKLQRAHPRDRGRSR